MVLLYSYNHLKLLHVPGCDSFTLLTWLSRVFESISEYLGSTWSTDLSF